MKRFLSYWLLVTSIFLFVNCKQTKTSQQPQTDNKEVIALLPDSINDIIQKKVKEIATTNKLKMYLEIKKGDAEATYIGFDGRNNAPITDFNETFEIGSATKLFTATSVLQLMEQGKFDLETPFTKILPSDTLYKGLAMLEGVNYIDSITVKNLLNHTSGLPDYFAKGPDDLEIELHNDASLRFSFEDLIALSKKRSDEFFKPNTKFEYSNINYILLGKIIEKTSGLSYTDYVQKHILNPLDLKHTHFGTKEPSAAKIKPHFNGQDVEIPYTLAGSAGEIISTLDDLIVFIDAWYTGKLFSNKTTTTTMLNDYYNDMGGNMGMSYGLGNVKLNNQSWGHAGQTFGTQAYAAALPNGFRFTICVDESQLGGVWVPSIIISSILSNQ